GLGKRPVAAAREGAAPSRLPVLPGRGQPTGFTSAEESAELYPSGPASSRGKDARGPPRSPRRSLALLRRPGPRRRRLAVVFGPFQLGEHLLRRDGPEAQG